MQEFYNAKTKETKNWNEIRSSLEGVVMSSSPEVETAKAFGWSVITNSEQPPSSDELKYFKRGALSKNSNGSYSYAWTEANRFSKKSDETAYFKQKDDEKAKFNRGERDTLLGKTDKYALSDYPYGMSAGMKKYRQELRDLPKHKNWPNLSESDWPEKP